MGTEADAAPQPQTDVPVSVPQPQTGVPVSVVPVTIVPGSVQWSVGLCECWNYGNLCCNIWWCTPCMLGYSHSAVTEDVSNVMHLGVCGSLVGLWIAGWALSWGLLFATNGQCFFPYGNYIGGCATAGYTVWQRQQIRRKYGISGDGCGDAVLAWFCTPCAIGQHHLELAQHGVNPGSVCCETNLPVGPAPAGQAQPAYATFE